MLPPHIRQWAAQSLTSDSSTLKASNTYAPSNPTTKFSTKPHHRRLKCPTDKRGIPMLSRWSDGVFTRARQYRSNFQQNEQKIRLNKRQAKITLIANRSLPRSRRPK